MTSALFTSSGTWTAPTGVTSVIAQVWAAGAGGAEASSGALAGGGGGGGEFAQDTVAVTPAGNYTVTIGAGGAGGSGQEGTGNGANGANGGNSSFVGDASATVLAHGGHGGQRNVGAGTGAGGAGGTGSTALIHFDGGAGGNGDAATPGGGGGGSAGGSAAGSAGGNSAGSASIAIVQSAQNTNTGTNNVSVTLTLASPTTAGNCLVACIASYGATSTSPSVSSVTLGGVGGNWASQFTEGTGPDFTIMSFWADPNCSGGQTSVKISCTGGSGAVGVDASVFEVSGLAASSPLDQSSGANRDSNGSTWTSGATGTTAQASEIAFGIVAGQGSAITGPGSPWTNLTQQTDALGGTSRAGYQILSSTGTVTYSGALAPDSGMTAGVITLKGAAGVGGNSAPAVALGGPGGNGGGSAANGSAPASGPGGGGGASADSNRDGGAGYAGQVILTWAGTPTPPVQSPLVEIPGPTASVLAGIIGADPSNPYSAADPSQRRQATVSAANYPYLPALMNDVVFMPEFAILDANITVTGTISAESGIDVTAAGQGLAVVEGTNCKQGTATLVAGVAVVQNTSVTDNSRIFLTGQADGASPGWLRVSTRSAGVSFTVTSSAGGDTSTFAYEIFEPG